MPKKTIGRREKVDFPSLNLYGVSAKIDTGAYTSAIHCSEIVLENIEGVSVLQFQILPPHNEGFENRIFRTDNFKVKKIKNSFGQTENRYIIKTRIIIGQKKYWLIFRLPTAAKCDTPF